MTVPTLGQTDAYLRFCAARALYAADTARDLAAKVDDEDEGSAAWSTAVQLAATAWADAARLARVVDEVRVQLGRQLELAVDL